MKPKCHNCKHASIPLKIGGMTHHQCCHPKHKEGFENGTLSAWDTLQEWYNTCKDHENKCEIVNERTENIPAK